MNTTTELKHIVDKLFRLFEQGEWDQAAQLFAVDAQIIQQFGREVKPITIEEFVKTAKYGPLSKVGKPIYLDRRVAILADSGFLEQHITQLTIKDQVFKLPVCLVGKFNEKGKIILLEEYLDPSPLMNALKS